MATKKKADNGRAPVLQQGLLDRLGELGRRLGPYLPVVLEILDRLVRRQEGAGAPAPAKTPKKKGALPSGADAGERAIDAHVDALARLVEARRSGKPAAAPEAEKARAKKK